jgi:hypothetical protein
MTRSKIEFATILATLRGQGEDPAKLAQDMSLRKLCYEIEKLENESQSQAETIPQVHEQAPEVPQEQKEPQKPKAERRKHLLSWLIDSSSEDES